MPKWDLRRESERESLAEQKRQFDVQMDLGFKQALGKIALQEGLKATFGLGKTLGTDWAKWELFGGEEAAARQQEELQERKRISRQEERVAGGPAAVEAYYKEERKPLEARQEARQDWETGRAASIGVLPEELAETKLREEFDSARMGETEYPHAGLGPVYTDEEREKFVGAQAGYEKARTTLVRLEAASDALQPGDPRKSRVDKAIDNLNAQMKIELGITANLGKGGRFRQVTGAPPTKITPPTAKSIQSESDDRAVAYHQLNGKLLREVSGIKILPDGYADKTVVIHPDDLSPEQRDSLDNTYDAMRLWKDAIGNEHKRAGYGPRDIVFAEYGGHVPLIALSRGDSLKGLGLIGVSNLTREPDPIKLRVAGLAPPPRTRDLAAENQKTHGMINSAISSFLDLQGIGKTIGLQGHELKEYVEGTLKPAVRAYVKGIQLPKGEVITRDIIEKALAHRGAGVGVPLIGRVGSVDVDVELVLKDMEAMSKAVIAEDRMEAKSARPHAFPNLTEHLYNPGIGRYFATPGGDKNVHEATRTREEVLRDDYDKARNAKLATESVAKEVSWDKVDRWQVASSVGAVEAINIIEIGGVSLVNPKVTDGNNKTFIEVATGGIYKDAADILQDNAKHNAGNMILAFISSDAGYGWLKDNADYDERKFALLKETIVGFAIKNSEIGTIMDPEKQKILMGMKKVLESLPPGSQRLKEFKASMDLLRLTMQIGTQQTFER